MDGWIPSVQMDQQGLLGPGSVFSDQPIFSAGLRSESNGSAGSCCWKKKRRGAVCWELMHWWVIYVHRPPHLSRGDGQKGDRGDRLPIRTGEEVGPIWPPPSES